MVAVGDLAMSEEPGVDPRPGGARSLINPAFKNGRRLQLVCCWCKPHWFSPWIVSVSTTHETSHTSSAPSPHIHFPNLARGRRATSSIDGGMVGWWASHMSILGKEAPVFASGKNLTIGTGRQAASLPASANSHALKALILRRRRLRSG